MLYSTVFLLLYLFSLLRFLPLQCTILTAKAEESIHLKDELDIAREEASNILRLSTTIEQLRKHADEVVSLRLRCSQLENDNQICVQRLTELEQETRLDGNIRSKVKAQARLQIEDAQFLANEAIKRAELAEQNLLKIRQELINVNREKEVCMFFYFTVKLCFMFRFSVSYKTFDTLLMLLKSSSQFSKYFYYYQYIYIGL